MMRYMPSNTAHLGVVSSAMSAKVVRQDQDKGGFVYLGSYLLLVSVSVEQRAMAKHL